jgi:hypothetical protein
MVRKFWTVPLLAAALLAGATGSARAGLLPTNVQVDPEGGNFRWTYAVVLPTDMKLQSGNYFTVYDFGGYVPGGESAPPGWTLSASPTGKTPPLTNPTDDPKLMNLTWTYTGATTFGQVGLGNFWAVSTFDKKATDSFTGQTNRASDGRLDNNITTSDVPTGASAPPPPGVPEPATLALAVLGLPFIGMARAFRRKKAASAAPAA